MSDASTSVGEKTRNRRVVASRRRRFLNGFAVGVFIQVCAIIARIGIIGLFFGVIFFTLWLSAQLIRSQKYYRDINYLGAPVGIATTEAIATVVFYLLGWL
jgi:hypothetical protein